MGLFRVAAGFPAIGHVLLGTLAMNMGCGAAAARPTGERRRPQASRDASVSANSATNAAIMVGRCDPRMMADPRMQQMLQNQQRSPRPKAAADGGSARKTAWATPVPAAAAQANVVPEMSTCLIQFFLFYAMKLDWFCIILAAAAKNAGAVPTWVEVG